MIAQDEIHAAYLRSAYGELVDPDRPVDWFGAGVFAHRLASALGPDAIARVGSILDDHPVGARQSIGKTPVRPPDPGAPPEQIVLATDTHEAVFRERISTLWGAGPEVVSLGAPSIGAWTNPGDGEAGSARTHPERWRESLGLAQLVIEQAGGGNRRRRWMLAHMNLGGSDRRFHFRAEERERFLAARAAIPTGRVLIVESDRPIRSDPFWRDILEQHHAAISPDGCAAAVTWARRDRFPVCPVRAGAVLWIPHEPTNIVRALYNPSGAGAKGYTVRFDQGHETRVVATRERTYADLRGSSELSRYERFIPALPAGARVLDCASGTGPGADLLSSLGFDVVGVDVDPDAVAFAGARYPGPVFVPASAAELPFPDDHFDAVISVETIEHLPDPGAALGEFARVCKPAGPVCLTTPDEGACDSPYHEIELTTGDLESALDRAFGQGAWAGEPVVGAGGWHAMVIRRRQPAHL